MLLIGGRTLPGSPGTLAANKVASACAAPGDPGSGGTTSGAAGGGGAGGTGAGGSLNPFPPTKCIEDVELTRLTGDTGTTYQGSVLYSNQTELQSPLGMFSVARLGGSSWALTGGSDGQIKKTSAICPHCFDFIDGSSSSLGNKVTLYRDKGNGVDVSSGLTLGLDTSSWSVDLPEGGKMLIAAYTPPGVNAAQCHYWTFPDPSHPEMTSGSVDCDAGSGKPFRRGASTVVVPRLKDGHVASDGGPYAWIFLLAGKGDLDHQGESIPYGAASKGGIVEYSIFYAPVGANGPGAWVHSNSELQLPAPEKVGYVTHSTGLVGASAFYRATTGTVYLLGGCLSAHSYNSNNQWEYWFPQRPATTAQSFTVTYGASGEPTVGIVSSTTLALDRCYAAGTMVGTSFLLLGGATVNDGGSGAQDIDLEIKALDTVLQVDTEPKFGATLLDVKLPAPLFGHGVVRLE